MTLPLPFLSNINTTRRPYPLHTILLYFPKFGNINFIFLLLSGMVHSYYGCGTTTAVWGGVGPGMALGAGRVWDGQEQICSPHPDCAYDVFAYPVKH